MSLYSKLLAYSDDDQQAPELSIDIFRHAAAN
ncbi:MAG: hypothetical protein QOF62_976 [Pyrinomonadaceae bacterium]|jgi:hypothetical protein|nr:hypothetical protein [Pyrinomonadaceae bacterium]